MLSLFLVLFLGTFSVQSALLPTTPLSQNSNETIVGCERKVYSWNVATTETQFSLSVLVTALSSADITIYFTRDAPDDIHFQDVTCDLGVSCTATAGSSCQVTQDCTATGLWYVIVTTGASGEEMFSLNTTLTPISVTSLPVGTLDEDLYSEDGVITGGALIDGASDFFVVTVPPTLTDTQQLVVRVKSLSGETLSAALNPTNLAGASCLAKHTKTGTFFDLYPPPCEVEAGSSWYITVTRSADDQVYQVKAWVEELQRTISVNGDSLQLVFTGEREAYVSITGIEQLADDEDLVASVESPTVLASTGITMVLTSLDLVPLCPNELDKEPTACDSGICMVAVTPCERVNKPTWNLYFKADWNDPSTPATWTVKVFSRKFEVEKRNGLSSIFGSLAQSERGVYSVPKPRGMNDWLELDLYMTDYDKAPTGAYLALYVYKDSTICKDNVMKACSYQNNGNTVISCTVQLDPCELDLFEDNHIYFSVVSEMSNGNQYNTIHNAHFTVDLSVRNPYHEPDRIQRGEIVTDGIPEYQYTNWPQKTRSALTRVYYVEPVPFGNFTFTFTPTAGNFLVQFFDIKDPTEVKIGPSCDCWGANRVVDSAGTARRTYSVDNYDPYSTAEYDTTFPNGLFIAVQPNSATYSDYEYNLGYTVKASNPTFAGLFAEGVQHKIEGMVEDEYRFYELSFRRKDMAMKYMVLDLKTIPGQVSFALFSMSDELLTAFKAGDVKDFLDDVHFDVNLPTNNNGEHVFVSDCLWGLEDDFSHWVLFVYSNENNAQFNLKYDLIRANPKRLVIGEPLNDELNRNEYHYFEVDVPQSEIDENKQLVVEVYFDQRHQTGGASTAPATFYLYHRGPSEYTVLTGAGDCRCHDDSLSDTHNVVWVSTLCELEAGIHTFSVRIPQQNPLPYKPKYTIKAKFVELDQGEITVGVPTNGEVFYGQTVQYSFTPPASLFDTNNADSKLTLLVSTPYGETVRAVVMEENTVCSCPGAVFDSKTGSQFTFEWTYCTTTAATYYLSITGLANTNFPIKYTISMKSDVRHPEVVPLSLVPCSQEQPEETFVYNGQYRQYSISITGSVSFRIQFTDIVDGSLTVFRNDEDVAVAGCGTEIGNFDESFGISRNIDECTTGDTSFHIGVYGVSNARHDSVRYRIRACTEESTPSFRPLGTRTTGALALDENVRLYYNLPSNLATNFGVLHIEASFDMQLGFSFVGVPKVCVDCPDYPIVNYAIRNSYDSFHTTCSLPSNMDSYNWYIEIQNNEHDTDVAYNVTVSSIQATAAPITISNRVETVINIPSLSFTTARYTPVDYNPLQVERHVSSTITAATSPNLWYYHRASTTESCATSTLATSALFCCENLLDFVFFNPTDTSQTFNFTIDDKVYMHYNTLSYPTEGEIVSITVPAAEFAASPDRYTYKISYPAAHIPGSLFNYNFSGPVVLSRVGPFYPGSSCKNYIVNVDASSVFEAYTSNHQSLLDPVNHFYLTTTASAASTVLTVQMKQVAPIQMGLGETWIGTLNDRNTPFIVDLSTFSRSPNRFITFSMSSTSSVTTDLDGHGTYVGTAPTIPNINNVCNTYQTIRARFESNVLPVTVNFSTSYVERSDPHLIFIPIGDSRNRAYPGAATDWTFETTVPPASQLTETSTLVFTIRASYAIDNNDMGVAFGCDTVMTPQNFVCIPTKDGDYICTIIIPRSELIPASFVIVHAYALTSEFTASFALKNPTMNTVSDESKAFSVSVGDVLYFRWDTKRFNDKVTFASSDSCGDARFYVTGGTATPSMNSLPRMLSSPSSSYVATVTLQSDCDGAAFHTIAVVLNSARNAETSIGFSVLPTPPAALPEIRPIFVNEIHTLMGRRVPDDAPADDTCPNPYVSSSVSTEKCDCPVVTTKYATDDVIYQITFDGFYAWDLSDISVEASEYVTGVSTSYYEDICGTPITKPATIKDTRQLLLTVTPTGFDVPDGVEEFPVATIHTTTHRQGKTPVAFSEEPQYILFTLEQGESQYFEIIHDESGRLDYAPSFRVIAVVNGSVGYTTDVLSSFYSTTPGTRCLDRIAYPDCPESISACNVGTEWAGDFYEQNLYNRTYVKLYGNSVAAGSHVVRGVVEVRFLRPYTVVTFEEDVCYELEADHTHVMEFNSTKDGTFVISTLQTVRLGYTPKSDPKSFIITTGCTGSCGYASGERYLLIRNLEDVSTAYYQLSWEPEEDDTTPVGTLNIGLNTFTQDANCVVDRPTKWQYTMTDTDSTNVLAFWNPLSGTNSLVTTSGTRNGAQFIPLCGYNVFDFTIASTVTEAELTIYEITGTPVSITPDADPTYVQLPAPGGTLAFTVDVSDEDFDGPLEGEIEVSFTINNVPLNSVFQNALVWQVQNRYSCGSVVTPPTSFSIDRCQSRSRTYYVHVPEQEKCGGTELAVKATWTYYQDELNPTGTDISFVPGSVGTPLPFRLVTTLDKNDFMYYRISNVRGTSTMPQLRVNYRAFDCCPSPISIPASGVLVQNNCNLPCTGKVNIFVEQANTLVLLPGYTHVTLDLEVVQIPRQILPEDGTELSVTISDMTDGLALIEAPLLPYSGHSYVFNITSGTTPLHFDILYPCAAGVDISHTFTCLPGAECQLPVPTPYHHANYLHGYSYAKFNIRARGQNTVFTARIAVTPAEVCSTVDEATAPFCSAVLSGEQWSISANHSAADLAAEMLYDQLVDDFSCNSFQGTDCTCPGKVSRACEEALKSFACHQTFLECNTDGFGQTTSYTVCADVERFCRKSFIDAVPNGYYSKYDCRHNHYEGGVLFVDSPVPDYEERPIHFVASASHIFSIFTLALILALLTL